VGKKKSKYGCPQESLHVGETSAESFAAIESLNKWDLKALFAFFCFKKTPQKQNNP